MSRRDRQIMLGLAVLSVAFAAVVSLTGLDPDVLLAAPALLLFLPLLAGRYVGEDGLSGSLRAHHAGEPCRRFGLRRGLLVCWLAAVRLIAVAVAERAPPALPLARCARAGRPSIDATTREVVLRLARENPCWGIPADRG